MNKVHPADGISDSAQTSKGTVAGISYSIAGPQQRGILKEKVPVVPGQQLERDILNFLGSARGSGSASVIGVHPW
jgi:hypothetical protein